MKNKSFQITIPEPCDQKFKDMTPQDGGRHCAQCDKVLVDFSVLTDKEIVELVKNSKGKLCGHFRKSQLNRDISLVPHQINSARGKTAGLLLASLLSGGNLDAQNYVTTPQLVEYQEVTINEKTLVDEFLEKEKGEEIIINGTIIDEMGEALIGATVLLKNTSIGTTTDIYGNFNLTILKSDLQNGVTLIFSYTGYSTIEKLFTLKNYEKENQNSIIMNEGILLEGIVIIRYGDEYESPFTMYEPKGFLHDWIEFFRNKIQHRKERRKRKVKKEVNHMPVIDSEKEELQTPYLPTKICSTKINNVSPNPFLSEIIVDFFSKKDNELEVTVSDINGRVIYFSNKKVLLGGNKININISERVLSNGTYYLRIKDLNGYVQTRTLVRMQE